MENKNDNIKDYGNFGERVLEIAPQLYSYVKHRLYTAESMGITPRNMYKTSGIIDDAILTLFEDVDGTIQSEHELKIKLFSLVSKRLDDLYKEEAFHKDTLSTTELLNSELKKLEENFEVDLDNDLLMIDELDDISYNQDKNKSPIVLYNDAEKNIIKSLDIEDNRGDLSEEKRIVLNKIYNWLPFESSNILDLFVFGKLTYEEIAKVKNIETDEVRNIIRAISNNMRKNLN